jgi:hypothetical protein
MPDHMRKQIRDYLAGHLAGLPTTGDRVHVGRTRALAKDHPPTLLIYMRSETSSRVVNGAPPKQERKCTLFVEGRTSTAGVPDDLLDQIALEVEGRVASLISYIVPVRFFDGLAQNVQLVGTELMAEADSQKHIGGVRLEYSVTYRVNEGAPIAAV